MFFDALTLAAVVQEIRERALGGRVQSVVQPDPLTVALELYAGQARHDLVLSAQASHPRAHFAAEKPRRGTETPSPLLLQMRKLLVGARLTDVHQPPWERILHLRFERGDETFTLIAEIMGKHSNVILVAADGTILECVKRVGPDVNRYRVVLPNRAYVPPPAQSRLPLPEWDEERLARLFQEHGDKSAERALVGAVQGVSPLAAREALARAGGADLARLLRALRELFAPVETGRWSPSVGFQDGMAVAYAPYELTHLGEWNLAPSISAAIETYRAAQETADPYAAARASVQRLIADAAQTLARRRQALEREMPPADEVNRLLECGQVLLAHLGEIRKGQTQVALPGLSGQMLTIDLNPDETPLENAQRYFKAYQKARAALEEVPQRLESLAAEEAYLAQLSADLALAASRPEIDEVAAALAEAGYVRERPRGRSRPQAARPLSLRSPDGFTVLAGRNSRQNEEVTFRMAAPDDVWLHVRGQPGAHVVIRSGGRAVPEATLEFAARLAAYHSSARGEPSVQVDWTQRKHVRRLPGGRPGMVHYSHEQSVVVPAALPDENASGT
ncbi:MAG: NFACT RNA binding domain-containing protein [Anaerolineae bacterium]|nr:NFACT RNA binding domain-containing protein [Anaerolineae bacterium]